MSTLRISNRRKPGRPATGNTKARPSLSINKAVLKEARRQAAKQGVSLSLFIEQATRRANITES